MRAGLEAAGWNCTLAIDNDSDAIDAHRLAHGDAMMADVVQLDEKDIPVVDVWVAGFPCQPFSSSGNRNGFNHRSGNVFENIMRLMANQRPKIIVLENVEGLLNNKSGHTFSVVLSSLTQLGYAVDWMLLDLQWFGPPQTRPRIFMVASQEGALRKSEMTLGNAFLPSLSAGVPNVFSLLLDSLGTTTLPKAEGSLSKLESELRPAIGKSRVSGPSRFGVLGHAEGDYFVSFDFKGRKSFQFSHDALGHLVAPNFLNRNAIRSGRYYARGGPTKLCLRSEPLSHCVGTSLGGAPLFAVPLSAVRTKADRTDFLEYSNWHREQDGVLVMRLRPNQAVKLFGPFTDSIYEAVTAWNAGDTRKYKLVGNLVAPMCAKVVAELITDQLHAQTKKSDRQRASTRH